jgi:hypothetical protein
MEEPMTEEQKSPRGTHGNGDRPAKGGVADPIQESGDVFSKIAESVSRGIAGAAKGIGTAGVSAVEVITTVVQKAVRDAIEGSRDLAWGAKAIMVGVLRATGEKGDAALKTLSCTARTVVRQAAGIGGDLAASVKGLVLGAIASAKDMGVDRSNAASAAGQGALEGAEEAGSVAAEKVREALKQTIGGVKVAPLEPIKK